MSVREEKAEANSETAGAVIRRIETLSGFSGFKGWVGVMVIRRKFVRAQQGAGR